MSVINTLLRENKGVTFIYLIYKFRLGDDFRFV